MKKLGWTQEGIKREAFLLDGSFIDFICWSVLDREWQLAKGRRE
jgi:RimJ/RimL family protein N-acetyltransferase